MAKPREEQLGAITLLDEDSTGTVDCNGARLTDVAEPTASTDVASKNYVDVRVATKDTLAEILATGNTTDGEYISVNDGYIEFGTAPAGTGEIRLSPEPSIYCKDGSTNDTRLLYVNSGDDLFVGDADHIDNIYSDAANAILWRIGSVNQGRIDASGLRVTPANAAVAAAGTVRLPDGAVVAAAGD